MRESEGEYGEEVSASAMVPVCLGLGLGLGSVMCTFNDFVWITVLSDEEPHVRSVAIVETE